MANTGSLRINEEPIGIVAGPGVDDDTTWILDLQAPQIVEYRSTELDQADPAGRYRLRGEGDEWLIQRAATAAWATATTLLAFNSAGQYIPDDVLFRLGTSGDIAMVLRSTTLAADTALTNVLVGTPLTPALAANSLIISNVTGSGDILIAARDGGTANSAGYLFIDSSAAEIYLYPRGGMAIGLADDVPAPDGTAVHIWRGSAGTVTASTSAALIVEHSAVVYLSVLTPNNVAPGLLFGDPEDNDAGQLLYDHTNVRWSLAIESTTALLYSAGAFAFQAATTISTTAGNLTFNAFNTLIVNSADFSGTPALTGSVVAIQNQTFTDNVTAASGTVAAHVFCGVAIPTFDSLNGGTGTEVTVTDAASYYFAGPPAAVTNKTLITNPWTIWVDAGNCRFDGDIILGSGTRGRLKFDGTILNCRNAADSAYTSMAAEIVYFNGAIIALTDGLSIRTPDVDANYIALQARDSGVGLVEVGRWVGAANPYIQIGRDDTGVALNAVTDMLVLQAGGGTGNEAAGFGLGTSWRIGNAASEVEERGSIDLVLVTATDTSEAAKFAIGVMTAGAMANILDIDGGGINLASGKTLEVAGTQVVGAQGLAVADVSDGLLATVITQFNTWLARARAHGLIAT